jgi:small subunit ribosomal protein S8
MQDPIADMFTRIRNAQAVAKEKVSMAHSKMKAAIAEVLLKEGYINSYNVEQDNTGKSLLVVVLKYADGRPVIGKIERVSRAGIRRYASVEKIPTVMGGLGIAIISTSKGLMTDHEARKLRLGGEILCYVS